MVMCLWMAVLRAFEQLRQNWARAVKPNFVAKEFNLKSKGAVQSV